jgi:hypothetical protein
VLPVLPLRQIERGEGMPTWSQFWAGIIGAVATLLVGAVATGLSHGWLIKLLGGATMDDVNRAIASQLDSSGLVRGTEYIIAGGKNCPPPFVYLGEIGVGVQHTDSGKLESSPFRAESITFSLSNNSSNLDLVYADKPLSNIDRC